MKLLLQVAGLRVLVVSAIFRKLNALLVLAIYVRRPQSNALLSRSGGLAYNL